MIRFLVSLLAVANIRHLFILPKQKTKYFLHLYNISNYPYYRTASNKVFTPFIFCPFSCFKTCISLERTTAT